MEVHRRESFVRFVNRIHRHAIIYLGNLILNLARQERHGAPNNHPLVDGSDLLYEDLWNGHIFITYISVLYEGIV